LEPSRSAAKQQSCDNECEHSNTKVASCIKVKAAKC